MAGLSPDELIAVKAHPLKKGLENFHLAFISEHITGKNINITEVVGQLTSEALDKEAKDILLDLILSLQSQPAARIIRSRTGNGPLSGDIASFYASLSSNQEPAKLVAPLLKLVVTQRSDATPQISDTDIWTAVFDLIARTRRIPQPTTPPPSHPSFTSSFQQTPWSFNTGSFADTSEHRSQVDGALKEELLPSLRLDIPDFVPAVFGQVPHLDELTEELFDKCQGGKAPLYKQGAGWIKWPLSAKEELVLEWLQDLTRRLVVWVNDQGSHSTVCRQVYQGPAVYLDGSPIKRKMDIGITVRNRHSQSEEEGVEQMTSIPISNWAEILVTGELKSNAVQDGQAPAWLNLATYAREVFRAQDRRFVLGFTLCGSLMRLWQFDRSGSSGSSSFDINEDGFRLVQVMLAYLLMNDKQLGLDPTIRQSNGKRYVEIARNGETERLVLTNLIKKQAMIAGRATTCWKAYRDGDESTSLIVKDSWQYEERPEEGEFIKEATDKGVRNIARYYHHETVQVDGKNDDIFENVWKGLMKKCGRTTFREKSFIDSKAPVSESSGRALAGRTQSRSASQKRSSSSSRMAPPPAKRSCSSLRSRDLGTAAHNRIRRRVITRDVGKTIQEASSPVAVLTGLLGAIDGHESLLDAGILHRDISIGNIMLTEQEDKGYLIDLDLAIKTDSIEASGAPSKTGTKFSMAIGALLGEDPDIIHDFESIFWSFFWICIHWNGPGKKRSESDFEDWNYLSTEKLAREKAGQVSKGIFNTVGDKVTAYCKPLIPCLMALHTVCFPEGTRRLKSDRELYLQLKKVLKKAREDLVASTPV